MACLFLIMLSSLSLQVVTWLEIIFVITGISLLAIEFLIIPGFGIAGILGILFTIGGLFAMMLPAISSVDFDFSTDTFNAAGDVFVERLAWLCGTFVLGIIIIGILASYVMPHFSLFKRLILESEESADDGYVAIDSEEKMPDIGARGEVMATLRPAGKVYIGDEVFDAISQGHFLEKGTPIVVTDVQGSKIVVEEIEAEEH